MRKRASSRPGSRGFPELGRLIRQRRAQFSLSVADIAEKLEVTEDMIRKVERGDRPVTHPETVRLLSEAIGVREDEIYMLQGIMSPDVEDLVERCYAMGPNRVRWALGKIAGGEMFDEEINAAKISYREFPGQVLVDRKRTVKEQREWEKIRSASGHD